MNKKGIIISAIVVILIILVVVFSGNSKSNNGESVKIGGLFALTGPISFAGEVSRNGLIMALEDRGVDINSVVIEDTQSKGIGAINATNKLIFVDNVYRENKCLMK